jgi:hypothetical protein
MTGNPELLACPFCGSGEVSIYNTPAGLAYPNGACFDCGTRGPGARTVGDVEAATRLWNTRATPALPEEREKPECEPPSVTGVPCRHCGSDDGACLWPSEPFSAPSASLPDEEAVERVERLELAIEERSRAEAGGRATRSYVEAHQQALEARAALLASIPSQDGLREALEELARLENDVFESVGKRVSRRLAGTTLNRLNAVRAALRASPPKGTTEGER